jgi:hypothetical protein
MNEQQVRNEEKTDKAGAKTNDRRRRDERKKTQKEKKQKKGSLLMQDKDIIGIIQSVR